MKKIFVDGSQGTTGLKIYKRFENRNDIELLHIDEEKRKELETIIFKETSTIGIRRTYMERTVLQRTFETISTPLGDAIFKVVNIEGNIRAYPEYESAKLLSEKHNLSIIDVYQLLERSYYEFSRHH